MLLKLVLLLLGAKYKNLNCNHSISKETAVNDEPSAISPFILTSFMERRLKVPTRYHYGHERYLFSLLGLPRFHVG